MIGQSEDVFSIGPDESLDSVHSHGLEKLNYNSEEPILWELLLQADLVRELRGTQFLRATVPLSSRNRRCWR